MSVLRTQIVFALAGVLALCGALRGEDRAAPTAKSPTALQVVVMDPLALPLSCPCVKGYAQRNYDKLGAFLQKALGCPVTVVYAESLNKGLDQFSERRADLVIGKRSVVDYDLAREKLAPAWRLALTGKEGGTTQTGLIVVRASDPAKKAADLTGYRVIFGPPECLEKHGAARALLAAAGVTVADPLETSDSCSDGATLILELPEGEHGAAVISSYAKPLLEGCGTIRRGDLRVVAETPPVPFVVAVATRHVSEPMSTRIRDALLDVVDYSALCRALETQDGFVAPPEDDTTASASKKN